VFFGCPYLKSKNPERERVDSREPERGQDF
jgi:hypothetical protein